MTNINAPATKPTTIVNESPSRLRVWWMNKNLRYNIAVNSFVIILNIAAILYVRAHKIPIPKEEDDLAIATLIIFPYLYLLSGLYSCIVWICGITDASLCETAYISDCICHILGLLFFLNLLYYISTRMFLFVGLHFVLPCLLWYLRPFLCEGMQALRDWWKFVNQPQSVVIQ